MSAPSIPRRRQKVVRAVLSLLCVVFLLGIADIRYRRMGQFRVEPALVVGDDLWGYTIMPMDAAQDAEGGIPDKCVRQVDVREVLSHATEGFVGDAGVVRCWDSVYLIGVSKGGTTALYAALKSHPSVVNMNPDRGDAWEMHYFDRRTVRTSEREAQGMAYLDRHSPRIAEGSAVAQPVPLLVHYTPGYVFYTPAAISLWKLHPFRDQIKFLVTLREPVSRMWSSYEYKHMTGSRRRIPDLRHPFIEFEEQWADVDRVARCVVRAERGARDGAKWDVEDVVNVYERACPFDWNLGIPDRLPEPGVGLRENRVGLYHHVGKGVYFLQLKAWFRLFDRRQFYVVASERLREGPDVHEDMVSWIGLPLEGTSPQGFHGFESREAFREAMQSSGGEEDDVAANETTGKRKLEDVLSAVQIASIAERYKPWNRRLNALLGTDFGYPT